MPAPAANSFTFHRFWFCYLCVAQGTALVESHSTTITGCGGGELTTNFEKLKANDPQTTYFSQHLN